MDQFEIRTHKRLLDIIEPTAKTVDELFLQPNPEVSDESAIMSEKPSSRKPAESDELVAGDEPQDKQGATESNESLPPIPTLVRTAGNAGFREYVNPLTGQGLGARDFSWTAAVILDLLSCPDAA